jgi:hypothetical protein
MWRGPSREIRRRYPGYIFSPSRASTCDKHGKRSDLVLRVVVNCHNRASPSCLTRAVRRSSHDGSGKPCSDFQSPYLCHPSSIMVNSMGALIRVRHAQNREPPTQGHQQSRHRFSVFTHLFRPRILHVGESSSEPSMAQTRSPIATASTSTTAVVPLLPRQVLSSAQAPVPSPAATLTETSTATKPATLGAIELCSGGPNPEIE